MTRRVLALLCAAVLLWPSAAMSAGACAVYKTYSTGDSFGATDANSIQTTLGQTNMVFSCLDDYSANQAEMETTTDPNSAGSVSLPTTGQGEVERLRHLWKHATGWSAWWQHYQDFNFGDRALRNHQLVVTAGNTRSILRGEQTWSGSGTRFHAVAIGVADQASHPESVLALFHVGGNTKFMVGRDGDLHAASIGFLQHGTASQPVVSHVGSSTGFWWPRGTRDADHVAVVSKGIEIARFHGAGVVYAPHAMVSFRHATGSLHVVGLSLAAGDQVQVGDPNVGLTVRGAGLTAGANRVLGFNAANTALEAKTLTAGTGVTITQGAGSVTVSSVSNPIGQVRLEYVTANTLLLRPWDGDRLHVAGELVAVPHAGVTLSPSGASANFTYHIYAVYANGTLSLHASATGHAHITGGFRVKATDDNHTYVGLARTNGSVQWVDSATQRFVRSWFNSPPIKTTATFSANRTTTSATFVELNTEIRNEFLLWSHESSITILIAAAAENSTANTFRVSAGVDGTTAEPWSLRNTPSGGGIGMAVGGAAVTTGLAEGYHFVTFLGLTSGGTVTYYGGATDAVSLSVEIQ